MYRIIFPDAIFIQRQPNRRILNMDELLNVTRHQDLSIDAIGMETLPFLEQLRIIRCSKILLGVQGAGLQWGMFMQPGSALVEIAWPEKGWNYYYSNRVYTSQDSSTYNKLSS